jgi:hypothetical protein
MIMGGCRGVLSSGATSGQVFVVIYLEDILYLYRARTIFGWNGEWMLGSVERNWVNSRAVPKSLSFPGTVSRTWPD